jgi:hypothetical protein
VSLLASIASPSLWREGCAAKRAVGNVRTEIYEQLTTGKDASGELVRKPDTRLILVPDFGLSNNSLSVVFDYPASWFATRLNSSQSALEVGFIVGRIVSVLSVGRR